jgi:hypothetical protein
MWENVRAAAQLREWEISMLIISGTAPESGTDSVSVADIVESPRADEVIFCLECRVVDGGESGSEIILGCDVFSYAQALTSSNDRAIHDRGFALTHNEHTVSLIVPTANIHRATALAFNLSDLEH